MKKSVKRVATYILTAAMLMGSLACTVVGVRTEAEAASTELTGKTAAEITEDMGFGWCLGNTFDATGGNSSNIYSQEQSWGNPVVTETLIKAVSDAGFSTIRIPVTWYKHISDDGSYTIDEDWLERIKTVVDYAYEYDLYVILNIHHEDWLNTSTLSTDYVEIGEELNAVWAQIADYFADYDQHLLFEGMNEPRLSGASNEWTGDSDAYEAVNYLNQIFVSTVRSSGKGYNDERCLIIPAYAASSSYSILNALSIPTYDGEACNNIIVSVHAYSPYDFCLSDNQTTFSASKSSDTSSIDMIFETIDELFLSQGIPVIIGESGVTNSGGNTDARAAWAAYMGEMAAGYGVPMMLWDNGYDGTSGGECHSYIDRSTGEELYPSIISALVEAGDDVEWGSLRTEVEEDTAEAIVGDVIIWSDEDGLTSTSTWDSSYITVSAQAQWFVEGRQIAVVYTGSGSPKLILDSAEVSAWWIQVSPTSTSTVDGKKVAYFDFDDIEAAYTSCGVTSPSQLRNLCVIATGSGNITTYEISTIGNFVATFMFNGEVYATLQSGLPTAPTMTNMEFAGWYSTKDYQSGTEYAGGELSSDLTLYAKFNLTLDLTPEDTESTISTEATTESTGSTSSNTESTTSSSGSTTSSTGSTTSSTGSTTSSTGSTTSSTESTSSSTESATSSAESATSSTESATSSTGSTSSSTGSTTSSTESTSNSAGSTSSSTVSTESTDNTSSANTAEYKLGDINQDGVINYLDAMMALRHDAELITLTDVQLLAGDVNGDGSVNSLDAILILRYDAGLIASFA